MRIPLVATVLVVLMLLVAAGVAAMRHRALPSTPTSDTASAPAFALSTTPAMAAALPRAGAPAGEPATVAVTEADLHGHVALIYFGYTTCPDVCPTELSWMVRVLRSLGPAGAGITPIFITIDPERDTLAKLAEYARLFSPRLVAMRGDAAQTAAAAAAFGATYHRNVPVSAQPGFYLMDHTMTTFVLDRDGRVVLRLSSRDTTPVEAADRIRPLLGTP